MSDSLISSFHIENFMSIEKADFFFDEKNFINLKGYNDSGKSAVLRALEVLFFNSYKTKQTSFIQDGKSEFKIVASFTDGVSIVRYKFANGQSLYEMYRGEDLLCTTRQGKALGKVEDVPEPIQQYLNFTKTGDGYLNSRSKEEPRLLVDTTGSENFKAISNILQAENLFKALQLVKEDTRAEMDETIRLRAELANIDHVLTSLPEEDFLYALEMAISDLDDSVRSSDEQVSKIDSVISLLEASASITVPFELKEIKYSQLRELLELETQIAKLDTQVLSRPVEEIDSSRLNAVLELEKSIGALLGLGTVLVEAIPEVDTKQIDLVRGLHKDLGKMIETQRNVTVLEKEMADLEAEMHAMVEEVGEDAKTFECFACGSLNVVGA